MKKTCFIENDLSIDGDEQHYMLRSIWRANRNDKLNFDSLFDSVILDANQHRKEVWEAINNHEYIFIKTGFIGDSARLLEEMCELALIKKLRDKTIVNFRDTDSHLQMTERGLRLLLILQARNNVKYVSQDTDEFEAICKELFA